MSRFTAKVVGKVRAYISRRKHSNNMMRYEIAHLLYKLGIGRSDKAIHDAIMWYHQSLPPNPPR